MTDVTRCPEPDTLLVLLYDDEGTPEERAVLQDHVDRCPDCADVLTSLDTARGALGAWHASCDGSRSMKRSLELSLALLFGCWFVGLVWEAEAVQPPAPASIAQLADGACDGPTDYWTLFAAASAAE